MKKVYIYRLFERFWHWTQAALILILALTGFEIHGFIKIFGFENAVVYHNIAAVTFLILIVFAVFWHFITGEWRQYIPTTDNMKAQINFYLVGIFRNAPHPVKRHILSKLNPLQRLTYFGLKILVIPIMVVSGLLYLYYRYPLSGEIQTISVGGLKVIALIHTAGAFMLVVFLIVHLYLITTGHTLMSNLEAMITGYEELESQDEDVETEGENINAG